MLPPVQCGGLAQAAHGRPGMRVGDCHAQAVGGVRARQAWQLQQAPTGDPLIQREAAALTRDYAGALAQLDRQVAAPPEIAPALHTLDESAAQIRRAIATEPNAHFLLDQLRRTYARRLELTQRAAMT